MGERSGVLILAGTGSLAYGVNAAGESALVGGWGYLLGDEGSGTWIGLEGLRAVSRADDDPDDTASTALTNRLLHALNLPDARALIPWLYQAAEPRSHEIAALAPLVLEQAEHLDGAALDIVRSAARKLAGMAHVVVRRLIIESPTFVFGGGLLTTPNPLSLALCQELGISAIPKPCHSPVIGAALLALID
jgi:N-acetylglucosamine kinase-like BadF-type ATPase